MHAAGKVLVKTYLKSIRDTFFSKHLEYVIVLSNRREKFKLLSSQGVTPPQFLCLVRHPNLPMRKTQKVVGLLNVMIFFQSKKIQHVKLKMKKRRQIFIF